MTQTHTDGIPRIVVVGAGFAGLACVRRLEKRLGPDKAHILLVDPTSASLYLPLLPQVASGVLAAASVAVPLARLLKHTIRVPGGALGVDLAARTLYVKKITGEDEAMRYDYLVLSPGSVTRTFDIPGLAEHAHGMKTLKQALNLRDHVIANLELAAAANTEEEKRRRCAFIVVGGGYAGTETCACLLELTRNAARRMPGLAPELISWTLADLAQKLMPELGDQLGAKAKRMLTHRGVTFKLGTSVAAVTDTEVKLTDGTTVPTETLVWTAGVAASPLVRGLGETLHGRVVVGADMRLPGWDRVFALGDCAAVPDLAKQKDGVEGAVCPPTAQHAMRQGKVAADNVISAMAGRPLREYFHKDLGLVVDLGGPRAVAKPLGIPLSGIPAQIATRGYHVMAMASTRNRLRVLGNWISHGVAGDDLMRVDVGGADRPRTIAGYEFTDLYPDPDHVAGIIEGLESDGREQKE
jgi:NADH:ubiquinone reductase (H+-translocating)